MKQLIAVLMVFSFFALKAQDSAKVINHEIGFNTVSLIKQVISNNPNNTLAQLPYDLFYNLYYNDLVGFRLGMGYSKTHTETSIFGQQTPRSADNLALNLRAGVSYNFVKSRRLTLNAFADFVSETISIKSANTFTQQESPDPIETITSSTTDKTKGLGAQVGVGVKYNIYRHLSLYAEVPITFISEKITSDTFIIDNGFATTTSISSKTSSTRIFLPTTIYLVLRF